MEIAIVGFGHVGKNMQNIFPNAVIYDEPLGIGNREDVNKCKVAFVCVPTPMHDNGACDTAIVEDVLTWLNTETIVLRSTVPVGFTDKFSSELNKNIIFQPEYYGETVNHPLANLQERQWITLGGNKNKTNDVIMAYQQVYTSNIVINIVEPKVAELAKYMENCFLALKVTFCNEFYDIAKALGVNYTQLRETWLLDPRIGRSHTFVYQNNRGYGGSCLPKDISAMIFQAEQNNVNCDLLKSVVNKNSGYKSKL